LREQEFGNTQNVAFQEYRNEQKKVGRFWYRFPTGESGADVLDRVKSWWENTLIPTNDYYNNNNNNNKQDEQQQQQQQQQQPDDYCDAVVVFSHGLTVRLILCQLFKWSISTFHSVYNANNCDIYILKRDLTKKGRSPYVLDGINGELPQSSIDVCVTFSMNSRRHQKYIKNISKSSSENGDNDNDRKDCNDDDEEEELEQEVFQKVYKLRDYLSITSPRMTRIEEVKQKLIEQYPDDFDGGLYDIKSISFVPFCRYNQQTGTGINTRSS